MRRIEYSSEQKPHFLDRVPSVVTKLAALVILTGLPFPRLRVFYGILGAMVLVVAVVVAIVRKRRSETGTWNGDAASFRILATSCVGVERGRS